MHQDSIFTIFISTWVVVGVISFLFFFLGNNSQLKKKVWPPFTILTSVLFLGFAYAMGFRGQVFYVMIPALIVITYLNIKATKFCDNCSKVNMSQNPLSPAKYCVKCGAELV